MRRAPLAFGGSALLALGLAGRIDALWLLPAEFAPIEAEARHFAGFGGNMATLKIAVLVGFAGGAALGLAISRWQVRRGKRPFTAGDIERILEAGAAGVSIAALTMGAATRNRKWFLLPTAVAAFLLLHAVEGWCPPLPILRRLGFRTQREIDDERTALKALRGDFAEIDIGAEFSDARRAWEAARA